jgi:hypothetical protein
MAWMETAKRETFYIFSVARVRDSEPRFGSIVNGIGHRRDSFHVSSRERVMLLNNRLTTGCHLTPHQHAPTRRSGIQCNEGATGTFLKFSHPEFFRPTVVHRVSASESSLDDYQLLDRIPTLVCCPSPVSDVSRTYHTIDRSCGPMPWAILSDLHI